MSGPSQNLCPAVMLQSPPGKKDRANTVGVQILPMHDETERQ